MNLFGLCVAALCVVAGAAALFYATTDTAFELLLGASLVTSGLFLAFFTLRGRYRESLAQRKP